MVFADATCLGRMHLPHGVTGFCAQRAYWGQSDGLLQEWDEGRQCLLGMLVKTARTNGVRGTNAKQILLRKAQQDRRTAQEIQSYCNVISTGCCAWLAASVT
jgi:hypothetical protein